jgi:hypothetical protein
MPKDSKAITPDLVRVCRRYYTRAEAEVAGELLYWSQFAEHTLRAGERVGFYKEDADLADAIGKHPSSIHRALSTVCAKPGEERPETLFIIKHGPRPWERSGRVRWLFITSRGRELIGEAKQLADGRDKKRQKAFTGRSGKTPPVSLDRKDQSAQNEPTLIEQNYPSESRAPFLSSKRVQRENPDSYMGKKEDQEAIQRVVSIWNATCLECKEPRLAWLPSDIQRLAPRLAEVIRHLQLAELSDEEISKRFRLVCGEESILVFDSLGPTFVSFNRYGLAIDTFAKFGPRVWRAIEETLR